jgi:hypothetical protein
MRRLTALSIVLFALGCASSATTHAISEPTSSAGRDPAAGNERAPVTADRPRTPSREDAIAAMDGPHPALVECATQHRFVGEVQVRVVFASSGTPMFADVTGSSAPLSDAARACMADALRSARIAPFTRETFTINYPYRFR